MRQRNFDERVPGRAVDPREQDQPPLAGESQRRPDRRYPSLRFDAMADLGMERKVGSGAFGLWRERREQVQVGQGMEGQVSSGEADERVQLFDDGELVNLVRHETIMPSDKGGRRWWC